MTGIRILTGGAGKGTDTVSVTARPNPVRHARHLTGLPSETPTGTCGSAHRAQKRSLGRYVPQTSRSTPQTSPTVARARNASFIG